MRKLLLIVVSVICLGVVLGCSFTKKKKNRTASSSTKVEREIIIYKTSSDCSQLVPITLNSKQTAVVFFPAPIDFFDDANYIYPIALGDGFFLDLQGVITPNTVFISTSYKEYRKLLKTPNESWMLENITNKHPFSKMYRVTVDADNIIEEATQAVKEKFKTNAEQIL